VSAFPISKPGPFQPPGSRELFRHAAKWVGCLTKSSLAADLLETVRTAHHGKLVFSSEVAEHLMKPPKPADAFQLNNRESEVLEAMAEGLTNQRAALRLFISQSTLKVHMRKIDRKMDVQTRFEALGFAVKSNLI
jgi:two-component system nitrate/nitrite response regulator NarP